MKRFKIGQRWIREMEPELGLGIVKHIDKRVVGMYFSASDCVRQDAIFPAPSKRVEFKLLPKMLKKCKKLAENNVHDIINNGLSLMETTLTGEVFHLVELKKVSKNIREEDISICKREIELRRKAILSARLRLDALRLISRGQV